LSCEGKLCFINFQSLATSQYGNLLFSPASVKAALGMIVEGAGGKSAKELQEALRLPDDEKALREQFKNLLNSLQVSPIT
jgi:serine protease inhibitor